MKEIEEGLSNPSIGAEICRQMRDAILGPIAEWNSQLQQSKLDVQLQRKRQSRLDRLTAEIARLQRTAQACLNILQKEQVDIEKLRSSSFSQFWLGMFGKLDDRLSAEEREAAEAKLKHDAAQASLQRMEQEKEELTRELLELEGAESRLERLMAEKEEWIRSHNEDKKSELEQLSLAIASWNARLVDIDEAVQAGKSAGEALMRAADRLESARNWGTYDMLGGGMISTMIKHGRIDEAQDHIHDAQHHLRRFAEELKDLQGHTEALAPKIGNFLSFADYFFDGFIADWMVQGRMNDSLESIESNHHKVSQALLKLTEDRRRTESEAKETRVRYEEGIESYAD